MKITIFAPWFAPHVGGVETVVALLAGEFVALGNHVTVLTSFPSSEREPDRPYEVKRRVGPLVEARIVRRSDVMLMFMPSLKHVWFPLCSGTPLIINHSTWLPHDTRPVAAFLQELVCKAAINVAPSAAIAAAHGGRAVVLPNPYDDGLFRVMPGVPRDRELVYVGRLVPEKGIDTLFEALALLRSEGSRVQLTIIGVGHSEGTLRQLAVKLNVADQLEWRGVLVGERLVEELNRHCVIVVPSKWKEPFGIVALEGLACGCRPVVSSEGGLVEAAGEYAFTFPNGDSRSLAKSLSVALREATERKAAVSAEMHLRRFHRTVVARRYLDFFEALIAGR